jgi:hypothetical protein
MSIKKGYHLSLKTYKFLYVKKGFQKEALLRSYLFQLDLCTSGQAFVSSFLQIPPHGKHPCLLADGRRSPSPVCDSHPIDSAHAVRTQKAVEKLPSPAFDPL